MKPLVQIAFDLSLAGSGDFFTLGDPAKGEIGGTSFLLAGDVLTDVSDDVRSVSIKRGRSRELDRFTAGQAQIVVDNRSRRYDPAAGTAISPFAPSIKPRKAVTISLAGQPVYSGQVEDIDLSYSLSTDSTTTFKVSDGLTLLTQRTIAAGTATAQKTGARMEAVLTGSEWPAAKRQIDTGVGDLGADVIPENTDLLKYLEQVASSESGAFFIGKDGRLRFRQRTSLQTDIGVRFADDGTGIPFSDISLEYGTEQLYTQVSVEYVQAGTAAPGTAVASNVSGQADYGFTSFEIKSLLDGETQAQDLADYYLFQYGEPTLRINSLTIDMEALTPDQQAQILSLELADGATVVFTPNGIGDPLTQAVGIDSISHDITPGKHTVKLDLSQSLTAFVLGESLIGQGRLGF
jgi:hypothetical protein